jgi:ATP-grasp domain
VRILALHQNKFDRLGYDVAIDHQQHEVVYACTQEYMDGIPEALRCAKKVLAPGVPVFDQLQPWMQGQPPFQCILARHEALILPAARLRDAFDIAGMRTAQATLFRDKLHMKHAVAAAGLRVPRNLGAREAMSGSEPPWTGRTVLKPRDGAGSAGVEVFASYRDALDRVAACSAEDVKGQAFLDTQELEEFIEGEVWHVDGYLHEGVPVLIQSSRYVGTCLEFELGGPSGSIQYPAPDLERWAVACLHALGAGSLTFHLEAIMAEDGPVFLEVAARCGGGYIADMLESRHGIRVHHLDMASEIDGALAERFVAHRAPEAFYGDFLYPGHTLKGQPCTVVDGAGLLDGDPLIRCVRAPAGAPLPTTRSYRPEHLPLSGMVRATDPDTLLHWMRRLFAEVRVETDASTAVESPRPARESDSVQT